MANNQNGASLFLTKLRERKDRNNQTYFIGSLGMTTVMMRPHKTNPSEWNIFLMEPLPKENNQQQNNNQNQGFNSGGFNSPNFNSSEDIPF